MSDCKTCEYEATKQTLTKQGWSEPKIFCGLGFELGTEGCPEYEQWPPGEEATE